MARLHHLKRLARHQAHWPALTLPVLLGLLAVLWSPHARANFAEAVVRFDRLQSGQPSDILIMIDPASAGTEAKLTLNLAAGISVGSPLVTTSGLPAGVTPLPGTLSVGVSGQLITISGVTDLSVGTTYGVRLTSAVTQGVSGQYVHTVATRTSGDAIIDSSQVASSIIAADQITVTASVPPTFHLDLDATTDTFLSELGLASVVSTSGRTLTIRTNASHGWMLWARSANQGLYSSTASATIPTVGTVDGNPSILVAGTSGYVLAADVALDSPAPGTGTVSIESEYAPALNQGGTLPSAFAAVATSDGPTEDDEISLVLKAAISSTVPTTNDYADTLTVIGAGRF